MISWILKYLSSLARLTAIFALIASATAFAETRQEHVHQGCSMLAKQFILWTFQTRG